MAEYDIPGASHGKITRWWQGETAAGNNPQPWDAQTAYMDELTGVEGQGQTAFARAMNARRKREIEGSNTTNLSSGGRVYQGNLAPQGGNAAMRSQSVSTIRRPEADIPPLTTTPDTIITTLPTTGDNNGVGTDEELAIRKYFADQNLPTERTEAVSALDRGGTVVESPLAEEITTPTPGRMVNDPNAPAERPFQGPATRYDMSAVDAVTPRDPVSGIRNVGMEDPTAVRVSDPSAVAAVGQRPANDPLLWWEEPNPRTQQPAPPAAPVGSGRWYEEYMKWLEEQAQAQRVEQNFGGGD